MPTILQELQTVLGVKYTDPRRLANKANDASNEDWRRLSVPTQEWVNKALEEIEVARNETREPNIPPLDGAAATPGKAPAKAAKPSAPPKAAAAKKEPKTPKPAKPAAPAKKPAKSTKPAVQAGGKKPGIHSLPAAEVKACREGTKQAAMVDLLARPEGATFDELHKAVNDKRFVKPWQEATTRSALHWDLHTIKGYGIDTEFLSKDALEATGRKAPKGMGADETVAVYRLVLPKGVKAPPAHIPRKSEKPTRKAA
jgi:hypothetical protein